MSDARLRVIQAAAAIAVAAPLCLGAARWPSWWVEIAPEQTAMTWLQSVVLVITGVVAALIAVADRSRARLWLLVAAGCGGLAIDERFALHERLRDGVLAPNGIAVPFLPWVAPGDFLLLGCAAVGFVILPRIISLFSDDVAARRALLLGVGLAAVAVGTDSIDPASWTVAQERVQQSLEECVELASALCFSTAMVLRLIPRLAMSDTVAPAAEDGPRPAYHR